MKEAAPGILDDFHWLSPPGAGWGWGPWACLLAGAVLLAVLGWYWVRRQKAGLGIFAPPPPHLAALRALHEWRDRLSEEDQREFVIAVSLVVRAYIQARFGLRAPHRSTEEFLREAQTGDRLLQGHQELLGGFLKQCDLVKFARRQVAVAQMGGLLDSALRFVQGTIPAEGQPAKGRGA